MSSYSSSPLGTPSPRHIWLFLPSEPDKVPNRLYLDIPLDVIFPLCLKPAKYLRFLCYCILAVDGRIHRLGDPLDDNQTLEDRAIYVFVPDEPLTETEFRGRADPEILKKRSHYSSSEGGRDSDFRDLVIERDGLSAFEATTPSLSHNFVAMHTIPHARNTSWLRLLITNRPRFENLEGVDDTMDIDDMRNGLAGDVRLHSDYNAGLCAILKTPNHVLSTSDIPDRKDRPLTPGSSYPTDRRITLHSFHLDLAHRNNIDASFQNHKLFEYPSSFLLLYRYGTTVLKRWGKNVEAGILPARPDATIRVPPYGCDISNPSLKEERAGRAKRLRERKEESDAPGNGGSISLYDAFDIMLRLSPHYTEVTAAMEAAEEERESEKRNEIVRWSRGITQGITFES